MIRTVLVDDEPASIRVLKNLLKAHCPEVEIIGEADSVPAALAVIPARSPDLVLLDISINDKTAFDLLNGLDNIEFQIIFDCREIFFTACIIPTSLTLTKFKIIKKEGVDTF
jgi:two-component system LytT family response regulator